MLEVNATWPRPDRFAFKVSPGDGYNTVEYRYDSSGSWQSYNRTTGIVYDNSSDKMWLNIKVTGVGVEPAVEATEFILLFYGLEPPAGGGSSSGGGNSSTPGVEEPVPEEPAVEEP